MSSVIVSIGLNFWQTELVKAANRLGYNVIGVDRNASAPGVGHCTRYLEMSAHDADGIAGGLSALGISNSEIVAVMTIGSRGSITCASHLAKKLDVRGAVIDENAASRLVDRKAFREFMISVGLPCPAYTVIDKAVANIEFEGPWIVKSVLDSSGSEGLTLVRNRADLSHAVEHALSVGAKRGQRSPAIVEQYIEGRDIGIFGMFQDGQAEFTAIVDRVVKPLPHCLPKHYSAPAELPRELDANALAAFEVLYSNLLVDSGPIYAEMRLCSRTGQAYILEAEPSLPAYSARVIAEALDIDLEEIFVRAITGATIPEVQQQGAAACHFVYGAEGRFRGLQDAWQGEDPSGLLQVRQPGERLDATNCSSIAAVCFATAETPKAARLSAEIRARAISIEVDKAA